MNRQSAAELLHIENLGQPDYLIKGLRDIERLTADQGLEENYIYFIESPAVLKRHPKATDGGLVLTIPSLAHHFHHTLIVSEDKIRLAFIALLNHFNQAPVFDVGVSPGAHVDPTATIAESARILAGASVMTGAIIGENCTLYPGVVVEPYADIGEGSTLYPCVVIGHHCVIGRHAIIHGGTVIGADGFGFFDQAGQRHKIPQIGNVVVEDNVEIGASCTVDRATIESTWIGESTKLDDQVHIAHNCRIGRFVYIVGNTAIAGSVTVGDGAMISGMVSIKDHVQIAAGSVVMAMTGVAQDTEKNTAYFGIPARPARQMHKMNAALAKLPELLGKVRDLERIAAVPLRMAGAVAVNNESA